MMPEEDNNETIQSAIKQSKLGRFENTMIVLLLLSAITLFILNILFDDKRLRIISISCGGTFVIFTLITRYKRYSTSPFGDATRKEKIDYIFAMSLIYSLLILSIILIVLSLSWGASFFIFTGVILCVFSVILLAIFYTKGYEIIRKKMELQRIKYGISQINTRKQDNQYKQG